MIYTDPGSMDRQIDIWDQPSEPNTDGSKQDPVVFATGVYAQIMGVLSTTEARRLKEQVVSEVTHKITIRYIKGLKSRMFIVYNDADNGARRFDLDRIVDPDEHKVELWILAIERNDGQ